MRVLVMSEMMYDIEHSASAARPKRGSAVVFRRHTRGPACVAVREKKP